jgi:hypothetical protein
MITTMAEQTDEERYSRKDIKFLSLVEDHPVFPKNVCKNLLFLGTITVKNDPATFSLLRLVFRYSGYVNVKCSSIYRGPKDIVHPCRCGSTLSNN